MTAVMVGACAPPETSTCTTCSFTPGDGEDPIIQAAREALTGTETVTLTLSNQTSYDFTAGVITFSQLFTVGSVPSTALFNYAKEGTNKTAKNDVLVTALGLTAGTNAFLVPALGKKKTVSITLTVPAGVNLNYLARVDTSTDDFVAVSDVPLSSGNPGTPIPIAMKGYDLSSSNYPAGLTSLGNGTVGAAPSNSTLSIVTSGDCPNGATLVKQNLLTDDFTTGANNSAWPKNAGWDGDFNGDWYTDGITARVWNPNWGGAAPGAPIPTTTGFWKFFDVCPAAGSKFNVEAKIATTFTDPLSDSTLVVYYFDRAGTLLSVAANHPLRDLNDRRFAIYDSAIPASTRRIAVAPMMFLAQGEKGAAFFDRVTVDYEAADSYATTTVATDDFSSYGTSNSGKNQPTGWTEFGGDWYAMTATKWATVWNPAFNGGAANVDTGMFKSFTLSGLRAGDVINAQLFAAATFSDKTSFARIRLLFNDSAASVIESDRQVRGYGNIDVRRAVIPTGATSVKVVVNAYLGAAETSSLYVDNFKLETQRAK